MTIQELNNRLRSRLESPLPGCAGQMLMAPRPREGWLPGRIPDGCRQGAGLLLLYPRDRRPHLVLTVRDRGLVHHPGQVALPGGALEEGESAAEAALREANEETGVEPSQVSVLGSLTPLHIPVSGFVLFPVVGTAASRPDLRAEAGEVARILEVPLEQLVDRTHVAVERREFKRRSYEVPYFDVEGEKVWGATAMVLAEFLSLLEHAPRPFPA